jgi:hypothetical protein
MGDWKEERLVPHLLGGLQTIENQEEECSDIEKREGSGCSKSQTPISRNGLTIERIERTAEDFRTSHKKRQNRISMR